MKKLLSFTILITAFLFISSTLSAQLNFFNNSPCAVRVKAISTVNPNACIGPYCPTITYTVAPGAFQALLPVSCFVTTVVPTNFRAIKFSMGIGIFGGADRCGNPIFNFTDCQGNPRTLQIAPGNLAAIY